MKKILIAVIAVVLVAALGIGGYFVLSDNNKEPEELLVYRDDFVEGINLLERFTTNPDRYKKALINEYQMGEDVANKFYEAPEEWLAYEQIIVLKNVSDEDLTIYGFEVKNNGKNGIYISTNLGGELGISAGALEPAPASFSVLCSDGELSSEEVKALADKMEISVVYSKTPTEYNDGTESVEEKKTAPVLFRDAK
ncbi:MAG: hypothetical protein IJ395_09160 [Clostridia bacterium]|nr:hypothetical protein [Clostridia bacterium]